LPKQRSLFQVILLLLPLSAGRAALAQQPGTPESVQLAQALYDAAVKEIGAKRFDTACPKLEEAVRLVPAGVGAKLTLAECYEGAGRLASAWSAYGIAASAAQNANQKDRQKLAEERAAALKPRLGMLTVSVPAAVGALPGVTIQRDGVTIGPAQWGVPLPADSGKHVIAVTATGRQRTEKAADLADGAKVVLEVPEPLAPSPTVSATSTANATAAPTATATAPPAVQSSPRRTVGMVVTGAGALGLVAGAVAGGMAISLRGQSDASGCLPDNHCAPGSAGIDLRRQSLSAGDWSTALFVGGGVAAAAGVVLWLTAPGPQAAPNPGAARGQAPARAAIRVGPASFSFEQQF
jgi:hypothetical protein